MTHPRTQLREDVKATLESVVGVPVFASRARDLPPRTPRAVLVYVADEKISPESAGTPYAPINRKSQLEILTLCEGDDEDVSAAADQICRTIELAMNERHPDAALTGSQIRYDGNSRTVKTIIVTTYMVAELDTMEA